MEKQWLILRQITMIIDAAGGDVNMACIVALGIFELKFIWLYQVRTKLVVNFQIVDFTALLL